MSSHEPFYPNQIIPLTLTVIVFLTGTLTLLLLLHLLNFAPFTQEHISLRLSWADILVGMVIYLKTSIDFAIFIGRLMANFPGWKNRIAIEIGTALGNIAGTLIILSIWDVFREVRLLMAAMIIIAALVLLRLAEDGLPHTHPLYKILHRFNHLVSPLLNRIIPDSSVDPNRSRSFFGLFILSFTVPFILGSDDFAGYIPLFNVVNVFGFATGVFLGHMLLNIALFISPHRTISAVKHPLISFVGSLAFVGLAIWGFREALLLLFA
jgi:hypothetical protein